MVLKLQFSLYLFFMLLLFNPRITAQENTPTPSEFLVGSYIVSSPNLQYTLRNNYRQILDLGLNSVFQRAVVQLPGQQENLDSLALFPYVFAANDTAPQYAHHTDNIDWVSYFTHAKYFRWEAEGDENFPADAGAVGIKHQFGSPVSGGWKSVSNSSNIGDYLIHGPNYTQYMKYVYTNRHLTQNPLIQYKAIFRMKVGEPQESILDVAKIIVSVINTSNGEETILAESILTTADLSTSYQDFILTYNYQDFPEEYSGYTGTPAPPPGSDMNPFQEIESSTTYIDFTKKVQFKVQWLGNADLYVDYIEVYDQQIWNFYFKENYTTLVSEIADYNEQFSELGTNLKYYGTMDEPHSWDSYIPIKKVQHILDSLNTGRDLLVHFYPGWSNIRDSVSVMDKWVNIAQPKKLMFWYSPFTCDDKVTPCEPYPREFTLEWFRYNLQEADRLQPDFFTVLQTFSIKDTNDNYHIYMSPTPAEVSAETMLSLAHGVKGIYFEEYYSRESWSEDYGKLLVENLVDFPQGNYYPPRLIWDKAQELTSRLKGKLGKTLMNLNYTGDYINILDLGAQSDQFNIPGGYLTLFDYNPPYHWHIGFLQDKINNDNKYFLLTNLRTTSNKTAQISITNTSSYYNLAVRDVENNPNSINTTISQVSALFHPQIDSGDGYLIQVAPVVKYGGSLAYADTIKTGSVELTDNMTIQNGINLINKASYTAKDTISLLGTGFITGEGFFYLAGNGEIIINSWSRSLFRSSQGNHPKIIWGKYPGTGIVGFEVYRKLQSYNWSKIADLGSSARYYIDSSQILPSGSNLWKAEYKVNVVLSLNGSTYSNTIIFEINNSFGTPKEQSAAMPTFDYNLFENYPNPFNPTTTIKYSLADASEVSLVIYDILGREVKILVDEKKEAGNYETTFDASSLPSGVYICRLEIKNFIKSQKMLLVK